MIDVRAHLARKPLLFDGGMGTYYKAKPGTECEQGNLLDPAGVRKVHREYLAAGAEAIKTNTFSLPRMAAARQPDWQALARAGWKLAAEAAVETGAAVFADLGPAPDTEAAPAGSIYTAVARCFVEQGAKNFLFETLSSDAGVLEAVQAVKAQVPDAFVLVSFAVLPDGYTRETLGERAKILAGIMPVVSQRNAIFMENEVNGIHVAEDIMEAFAGLDREQGEALGLEISLKMAREALPYADGFYLMTPFNRVALMERLIARLKTELLQEQ